MKTATLTVRYSSIEGSITIMVESLQRLYENARNEMKKHEQYLHGCYRPAKREIKSPFEVDPEFEQRCARVRKEMEMEGYSVSADHIETPYFRFDFAKADKDIGQDQWGDVCSNEFGNVTITFK